MDEQVLITGAGSGIGLAAALHIARAGYRTVAGILEPAQADDVAAAADREGVAIRTVPLDVADPAAVRAAVDSCAPWYGVVHSAGLGLRGFFEDLTHEEIVRVYDVNVFGAMAVARAVLPGMRQAGRGRIILLSSAGGRIAAMGNCGYSTGKFALEGFAESLAMEVAPFHIAVSLIEPGLVLTPHFTRHRGRARRAADPESPYFPWFVQHEHLVDDILLKRRTTPDDVAKAVLRALRSRRPRLHYPVGRGARLTLALRRHLPDAWFERLYYRELVRRVTRPSRPAAGLRHLALPGEAESQPPADAGRGDA